MNKLYALVSRITKITFQMMDRRKKGVKICVFVLICYNSLNTLHIHEFKKDFTLLTYLVSLEPATFRVLSDSYSDALSTELQCIVTPIQIQNFLEYISYSSPELSKHVP